VHGVDGTDSVAGQGDVDAVTTDLNDHAGSSSGVHGVGASNVESESGAQSKADSAESSAKSYTDNHENKNNPHSSSASDTDLSNHVNDGTNPHGVTTSQIGALASTDYNPESDTHSRYTDSEAASAAPVQSVNGQGGSVTVSGGESELAGGWVTSSINTQHVYRDALANGDEDYYRSLPITDIPKTGFDALRIDWTENYTIQSAHDIIVWRTQTVGNDGTYHSDELARVTIDSSDAPSGTETINVPPQVESDQDLYVGFDGWLNKSGEADESIDITGFEAHELLVSPHNHPTN